MILLLLAAALLSAEPAGPVKHPSEIELIPWEARREALLALAEEHFDAVKDRLYAVRDGCPLPELVQLAEDDPHLYLPPVDPAKDNRSLRPAAKAALLDAAKRLQDQCPGCRIGVSWTLRSLRQQAQNWNRRFLEFFEKNLKEGLAPEQAAQRAAKVRRTARPTCKAPHTTGAAVDILLLDASGKTVLKPGKRFWYQSREEFERGFLADTEDGRRARMLEEAMTAAGFVRSCHEAWHFNHEGVEAFAAWTAAGRPGRCWGPERERAWDTRFPGNKPDTNAR